MNVRIPQITDIGKAIELYYARIELSNEDIKALFGAISTGRILRLKNLAKERMLEEDVPYWNALHVNTKTAYEAWGLDIKDLEIRYAKLRKLGMLNNPQTT